MKLITTAAILSLISVAHASAISTTLDIGTLGIGLDVNYKITKMFDLTLNYNSLYFSAPLSPFEKDEVSTGLNMDSMGIMLDIRPFEYNNIMFNVGAYYLEGGINIHGKGGRYSDLQFNNRMDMDLQLQPLAGYIGLGYTSDVTNVFYFMGRAGILITQTVVTTTSNIAGKYSYEAPEKNSVILPAITMGVGYSF